MTELLQGAIAAIESLPADLQDAIAASLLAEVVNEQAWERQFRETTDAQWDEIAERTRRAVAAGEVTSLSDVFPPGVPS